MGEPVVLITLPFNEALLAPLRRVAPQAEFLVYPSKRPEEIPAAVWERVEVLYTNFVLPTPEQAPNLRWVQFHWAGVDHAIRAPLLQQEGIVATSLSGAAVPQMGEYILMMLLALGHRLPALVENQRQKGWPKDRWHRFLPVELNASTVGIVGYGSLGRETARLLHAFGAQVLATKRDARHPEDHGYTPPGHGDPEGRFVRRLYPAEALLHMLPECDFVVVTVPLTPATHGLIGREAFAAMKPGACLVDVSRGGVVDHEALVEALRSGHLAGAALDVFPTEPLPPDSPLWEMPNVLLTPHIAGATAFYDQRAMALFAENLRRYLTGEPLLNRVDPQRGY